MRLNSLNFYYFMGCPLRPLGLVDVWNCNQCIQFCIFTCFMIHCHMHFFNVFIFKENPQFLHLSLSALVFGLFLVYLAQNHTFFNLHASLSYVCLFFSVQLVSANLTLQFLGSNWNSHYFYHKMAYENREWFRQWVYFYIFTVFVNHCYTRFDCGFSKQNKLTMFTFML